MRKAVVSGLLLLLLVALAVAFGVWFFWQAPLPLAEGPPRGARVSAPPVAPPSVLVIPVVLPLADMQDSIQEQIPRDLVEVVGEEAKAGFVIDVSVRREHPLQVSAASGDLLLTVPLALDAKVYHGKTAERRQKKGKDAPRGVTLDAALELTIRVDLTMGDDWHLVADTHVEHRWTSRPTLEIGPLHFDVTKKVDQALVPKLAEVEAKISERIASQEHLPTKVKEGWLQMAQAAPMPGGGWLVVRPERLFCSAPDVRDGALRLTVGAVATVTSTLGERPVPAPLPPLPPPSRPPRESGLEIAVEVALPWEMLSERATTNARAAGFTMQGGSITVSDVEVYPSGEHFAVGVSWAATSAVGDTSGLLWLLGRPQLDRDERLLRVVDFDYVLDGPGARLANLDAVREAVNEKLADSLVFDYGAPLDSKLLEARAAGPRELEGGTLHLDLQRAELTSLALSDAAVVLHARLSGSASVQLSEMPPLEGGPLLDEGGMLPAKTGKKRSKKGDR
jgi:hypothetical protein